MSTIFYKIIKNMMKLSNMMIIINIRAKIAILKPLLYSINFEKLFLKIVEKHSGSPHNNTTNSRIFRLAAS